MDANTRLTRKLIFDFEIMDSVPVNVRHNCHKCKEVWYPTMRRDAEANAWLYPKEAEAVCPKCGHDDLEKADRCIACIDEIVKGTTK